MRQSKAGRLNPVAAAAAHAQASFREQLHEANLKLPIKDAMRELAVQMQEHLDAELKKAVQRYLGFELTDPAVVSGRLVHARFPEQEHTVYYMDGVPILTAGPQVLERVGDSVHAFQPVTQELPEDYKPPAAGGIILL